MGWGADEVRRAAALARLELTDDEAETLAVQLGEVLARIDALGAPQLDDRSGGGSLAEAGSLRSDEPGADPMASGPGSFAPGWTEGFFTVPRLSSHGGEEPVVEQEEVP